MPIEAAEDMKEQWDQEITGQECKPGDMILL